jgi:hypothetical protein
MWDLPINCVPNTVIGQHLLPTFLTEVTQYFLLHINFNPSFTGSICLLESSFLLESEFQENKLQESELFSDVW